MTHTDAETELRTRFARAADQIPVGQPPTADGLRAGADRRRTWRAIAVAAAAGSIVAAVTVVSSQLGAGPEESATPPADTPASESAPERMRLDCPNDLRSSGILDGWPPPSFGSPVAVAMPYVDQAAGESTRVIKREDRTYVWILRPDGTARARIAANYSAYHDGWLLGPFWTCGDESLVPPRNRP